MPRQTTCAKFRLRCKKQRTGLATRLELQRLLEPLVTVQVSAAFSFALSSFGGLNGRPARACRFPLWFPGSPTRSSHRPFGDEALVSQLELQESI